MRKSLIFLGIFSVLVILKPIAGNFRNIYSVKYPRKYRTLDQLYLKKSHLNNCRSGKLKQEEKARILERINYIRGLHKLTPLSYGKAMPNIDEAALIGAANDEWKKQQEPMRCLSEAGKKILSDSLGYQIYHPQPSSSIDQIALVSSESLIDFIFQDHRRSFKETLWLLNPFFQTIQVGRADGRTDYHRIDAMTREGKEFKDSIYFTSVLLIHFEIPESQSPDPVPDDNVPEFVAYPYRDYPIDLFRKGDPQVGYPKMIFMLPDYRESVSFSDTRVSLRDLDGNAIPIQNLEFSEKTTLLGHYISWQTDDIKPGKPYFVKIMDVWVNDEKREYTYWFDLQK